MQDLGRGMFTLLLCAGGLLLLAAVGAYAWNDLIGPAMGADQVGSGMVVAFLGPLWLVGLPLTLLGVAGLLLTRRRRHPRT